MWMRWLLVRFTRGSSETKLRRKRERGIPSHMYNWKHSTEMCLPHLTQPLWMCYILTLKFIEQANHHLYRWHHHQHDLSNPAKVQLNRWFLSVLKFKPAEGWEHLHINNEPYRPASSVACHDGCCVVWLLCLWRDTSFFSQRRSASWSFGG